jgi:UDP-glucose 4-epimerase
LKTLITGGAGFIGSNLVSELQKQGDEVRVVDNFSSSLLEKTNLKDAQFIELNLANPESSKNEIFQSVDRIFHLAANVDNRFSWANPHISLESNITATLNVALAARNFGIPKIIYASTGTIYGDLTTPPFQEYDESSRQTTLYGATKYAAEGILSVFATHYDIKTTAFRFVGVLGPHSSHGHLFDFVKKLKLDSSKLFVLGNGYQKKAYVHVSDLINGILSIESPQLFDVFNLGRSDYSTVRDSVRWLLEEWGITPEVIYEDTDRGWIGDNPFLQLDVRKALETGWTPKISTEVAVKSTVRWMLENDWIFEENQNSND